MEKRIFDTQMQLAEEFCDYFEGLINGNKKTYVALSGGSTPKIVFDLLATKYKDRLDWSSIYLFWGDERCVPPTDEESNYHMTVEHLLSKIRIPDENIFRIMGENLPKAEARRYSELLDDELPVTNKLPTFDLVMLGMGDDGHTVSIFPKDIELWGNHAYCVVATHPGTGQKRVSLTGKIVNNAKNVAFLVTGANKAARLSEIFDEGTNKEYPAGLVKPLSGNLIWFMDKAAAGEVG